MNSQVFYDCDNVVDLSSLDVGYGDGDGLCFKFPIPYYVVEMGSKFAYEGGTANRREVDLAAAYELAFGTTLTQKYLRFEKTRRRKKHVRRMRDVLSGDISVPDIAHTLNPEAYPEEAPPMKPATLRRIKTKYEIFSKILSRMEE